MAVGVPTPGTRAEWLRYEGRHAAVAAPPGSFAASRAPHVLEEAERTVLALQRLLEVPVRQDTVRVDIVLVDAAPAPAGLPATAATAPPALTPGAVPPVVRAVSPEGSSEPLAQPMARALVAQWFGPDAAAAHTVVRGLAGMAAARAGSGPALTDADTWVQARLADGTLPSLFTGPAAAPPPAPQITESDGPDPILERLRRSAARPGYHVAVREAGDARLVELPSAGSFVVGRAPGSDLVLDESRVSREHAVITTEDGRAAVRASGSRNGTKLNGEAVTEAELSDGDRLTIGRWELVVLRIDAPGAGPAAAPAAPAPPTAAERAGADLALTSFAAFLLDAFGAEAVREFLRTFDPVRQDTAAVAVFHTPLGALEEDWHNRQRQRAAGGAQVRAFAAQIIPLLAPHKWRITELTVLMLLATINTLALPLGFRYFVDDILPSRDTGDLFVFTAILSGFFLAGTLVALRRTYLASKLSERIGVDLQERMFAHMQTLSHGFFSRIRGGDLLSRFTRDLTVVQQAIVTLISGGVALVVSAAAAFVTLALLNGYIAALVASVLPLYIIAHLVLHTRFRRLAYERQAQAGEST